MAKLQDMGEHVMKNEDGIYYKHSGYVVKVCPICEREFLVGRDVGALYIYCGFCVDDSRHLVNT